VATKDMGEAMGQGTNGLTAGRTAPALPADVVEDLAKFRDGLSDGQWVAAEYLEVLDTELGRKFNRKQAADVLDVLPSTIGTWVVTARKVGYLRDDPKCVSIPFSSWVYIARDDEPEEFLDVLAQSMDKYGGSWPPVRAIRQRLAERKGKVRKPKPDSFTATVFQLDPEGLSVWLTVDSEHQDMLEIGMELIVTVPDVEERTAPVEEARA
jgi:hypothetical protein